MGGLESALQSKQSSLKIEGTVRDAGCVVRNKLGHRRLTLLLEGEDREVGPNLIEVQTSNLWADALCFTAVGDVLSVDTFEVETTDDPTKPFCAVVTDASRVVVTRNKTVTITALNVGTFVYQNDESALRQTTAPPTYAPPRVVEGHNHFLKMGKYYDVLFGNYADFNQGALFVLSVLSKKCKYNLLDVACGSGLYTFFLRYFDFKVTGIDTSHVLLGLAQEKLQFQLETEPTRKPETRLLSADMTNFEVEKAGLANKTVAQTEASSCSAGGAGGSSVSGSFRTANATEYNRSDPRYVEGAEFVDDDEGVGDVEEEEEEEEEEANHPWARYEQFDSALCINAVKYLPNMEAVQQTLRRIWFHLERNGVLIIDVPNVHVQGAFKNKQEVFTYKVASSELSISAAQMEEGTLDVVRRTFAAADSKRRVEYHGSALQKSSQREQHFATFEETCEELVINPVDFEALLKEEMFDIEAMHGDLQGTEYSPRSSELRVYVCVRKELAPDH